MNQIDLSKKLAFRMGISKEEADKYLNAFLDSIVCSLQMEERVVFRGFGCFRIGKLKSFVGRNPKNGESKYLPIRNRPVFRAYNELKEMVDSP